MIKLILNSQYELDGFDPNEEIAITFSEAELTEFTERGGTLSNNFKLAKTVNNQRVLQSPELLAAQSNRPYTLFDAELYVDNAKIFTGTAALDEVSEFYTVRLFGAEAGFFSQFDGLTLKDVDLSEFDHAYEPTEIAARRTGATGLIYPNINYGRWTGVNKTNQSYSAFFPAIYLNTLFQKIAEQVGYTYIANDGLNETVIPHSEQYLINQIREEHSAESTSDKTLEVSSNLALSAFYLDSVVEPSLTFFKQNSNVNGDWTSIELKPQDRLQVRLQYRVSANRTNSAAVRVEIQGAAPENTVYYRGPDILPGDEYIEDIELLIAPEGGFDEITIRLQFINFREAVVFAGAKLTILSGAQGLTDYVQAQDAMPPIEIKELFKYAAVRLQALILVDSQNRTVHFEKFDDIAGRYNKALDLSEKIADIDGVKTRFEFEDYAQQNRLVFTQSDPSADPTSSPKNIGLGLFEVPNAKLKRFDTLYKSELISTGIFTSFINEKQIPLIPKFSDSSVPVDEPDQDPGPRVLEVRFDSTFLVNADGVNLATQPNTYPYTFQEAINDNYGAFIAALDLAKTIEVDVILSIEDLPRLNFATPVFLLDSYWFVREIRQFRVDRAQPTTLSLFRIS